MAKFCLECGAQLDDSAVFCKSCGTKLMEAPPQPESAPPPLTTPTQNIPPQNIPPQPESAPPPLTTPTQNIPPPPPQYIPPQPMPPTQPIPPTPPPPQYTQNQPQYAPPPQPAYVGVPASPTAKKFPKWLIIVIIAVAAVAAAIIIGNLAIGNAAEQDYFKIGPDQIPSVKLILGELRETNGISSSTPGGVETKVIEYKVAKNQNSEMQTYAEALISDYGFINTSDYNFTKPAGSGFQFTKESIEEGYIVIVEIDYDAKGYTLTLMRGKGTLTVYNGEEIGPVDDEPLPPDDDEPTPPVDDEPTPPVDDEPLPGSSDSPSAIPGSPRVFDFTVLSKDVFPRGQWTVNKLDDKFGGSGIYGNLKEVAGYYDADYGAVWFRARFERVTVHFAPESVRSFSFYKDSLASGDYTLGDKDKDIEIEIASLRIVDPKIELPYGIKLLETTKKEILSIYPFEPPIIYSYDKEDYFTDLVGFLYGFPDGNSSEGVSGNNNGSINYYFDKNGILESVDISWLMLDL